MNELKSKCCGAKVNEDPGSLLIPLPLSPIIYVCENCHKPTEVKEKNRGEINVNRI